MNPKLKLNLIGIIANSKDTSMEARLGMIKMFLNDTTIEPKTANPKPKRKYKKRKRWFKEGYKEKFLEGAKLHKGGMKLSEVCKRLKISSSSNNYRQILRFVGKVNPKKPLIPTKFDVKNA